VEKDALFEQSQSPLKLASSEAEYNLLSLYSADVSNSSIYFLVPTYKYTTQQIHKLLGRLTVHQAPPAS
jgi:hypothetical protein